MPVTPSNFASEERLGEARVKAIDLRAIISEILGVEAQDRLSAVITIEVPGQNNILPEDTLTAVLEPPVYRLLPNLDVVAVFNFVKAVVKDNLLCHDLQCQFSLSQEAPAAKWTMRVSDQDKREFHLDTYDPDVKPAASETESET